MLILLYKSGKAQKLVCGPGLFFVGRLFFFFNASLSLPEINSELIYILKIPFWSSFIRCIWKVVHLLQISLYFNSISISFSHFYLGEVFSLSVRLAKRLLMFVILSSLLICSALLCGFSEPILD